MFHRRLSLLLPALLSLLFVASSARAQTGGTGSTLPNVGPVLVYRIQFTGIATSINFRNYTGGYYIADLNNGSSNGGTLILLQVTGGIRSYYQTSNFGQLFYAAKSKDRKAIIVGNTGSTGSSTVAATTMSSFFVMGDAKDKMELSLTNGTTSQYIAKELKGQALFADSQEDLPFALAPGEDVGTAAMVNVTFKYDESESGYSQDRKAGRSDMVTKIISELVAASYVNGNGTGGTGGGTGTGGGVTNP